MSDWVINAFSKGFAIEQLSKLFFLTDETLELVFELQDQKERKDILNKNSCPDEK